MNMPTVFGHYGVHYGQAETGSHPDWPCGDERFQQPSANISGNAGPVVFHAKIQMLMITVPAHAYGALGSGLYGGAQQGNQRSLQARASGLNRRAPLGLVQYDLRLLTLSFGFDLLQGRLRQFIRVYVAWLGYHRAGEVHQLANDALHAVQLLANVVECLSLARVQATQSALRLSVRNAEGRAQFVGNTRGKTPNGRELFTLTELGF